MPDDVRPSVDVCYDEGNWLIVWNLACSGKRQRCLLQVRAMIILLLRNALCVAVVLNGSRRRVDCDGNTRQRLLEDVRREKRARQIADKLDAWERLTHREKGDKQNEKSCRFREELTLFAMA